MAAISHASDYAALIGPTGSLIKMIVVMDLESHTEQMAFAGGGCWCMVAPLENLDGDLAIVSSLSS